MTETTTDTPEQKPAAGRVSITDDAHVMYQADSTNPLPGDVVGTLKKGEHILDLNFDPAAAASFDGQLLVDHINGILASLAALEDVADAPAPVQDIAKGLRDGLGIVARADYADQIKALDDDMRAILRGKGVRFGPLYIFCYDLNKPAAVRLRGLLYALFHDITLPAPVPADGMVSKAVDTDDALKGFFTAIGYPVYGGRCIRIDMLDRVVNLVYETADKGKFKAQHSMAEWFGCGIADLYAVLESLGHTKVYDPADEAVEAEEKTSLPEGQKPELATFALKKADKASGKKPFKKADKKPHKAKSKGKPKKDRGPRVMSAQADASDVASPFDVLKQLQK